MDDWIETTIGDQVTLQRGHDITRAEQRPGSIPVVSSGGVSSYHDTAMASGPGVVIGRKGTLGKTFFMPSAYWPHDTTLWVRDFKGNDERFVYYFFVSMSKRMLALDNGSANPTLNRNHVHPTPVLWPPLPKQRAIAGVLGALDDKIEVNRKQARVLEGIARAVFTSWFVNFDPVRRAAPGYPTGLPPALAAFFPKRLVDSPIGEVPDGWRVEGLDASIKFLNGLALQKFPPVNGRSLPVIKIAQLRKGDTEGADRAAADLDPEYIVGDGDVLFSWSGSLECVLWAGGPGALNQHLFKVSSAALPKWFYYLWVHHHLPGFRHIAAGKATTMGHIQRHHLTEALVAIPGDKPLMKAMDRFFSPLIESMSVRAVQNRTLAALRDALLPKLISGELWIAEAEKIVGRAV